MTEVFNLERDLENRLVRLKEEFGLCAVKAEFEAEGASFRDLVRLRRLTARQDVPLYLKIGGVEALRDIKDALDLGVDGLIAPMVESPFGIAKFIGAVESLFHGREIFKSINIETRNAVEYIEDILVQARGKIDNVTIGRTDLSLSYFDPEIQPDSEFILDLIGNLSHKIHESGLALTVGGSLSKASINRFKERLESWGGRVSSIETRKIVLPADRMLDQENALEEALGFEDLYLRLKLETEQWISRADRERLAQLKSRM